MSGREIKNTIILAWIFACRMLGLFMIYPVLALYTDTLSGATPALIGLAMGIYGLTQALFQLPFGWLSDYFGRKPIILGGLVLFAVGSLMAAFSNSIEGVIVGRAVQGMGAIGSPILAWVADTTRESVRTRAMALIGVTIGLTFALSLVMGPWVNALWSLSGLFFMTAGLAVLGVMIIVLFTQNVPSKRFILDFSFVRRITRDPALWGLYSNIFVLHALLSASFLVLPMKIQEVTGLTGNVWQFYLPVLGLSLFLVAPMLRYAEEPCRQYRLMQYAMLVLAVTTLSFILANNLVILAIGVTGFFVAFNFLEASLPSMVSRVAPEEGRGTALGFYSCSQFLGLFTGGALGGALNGAFGLSGLGAALVGLALIGWGALKIAPFSDRKLQIQTR